MGAGLNTALLSTEIQNAIKGKFNIPNDPSSTGPLKDFADVIAECVVNHIKVNAKVDVTVTAAPVIPWVTVTTPPGTTTGTVNGTGTGTVS